MSPEDLDDLTYQFFDEGSQVRLILIADGEVQLEDCQYRLENDQLTFELPNGDRWVFPLYAEVHTDLPEVTIEKDPRAEGKTLIKFDLIKQIDDGEWPQVYRDKSKLETPFCKPTAPTYDELLDGPETVFNLTLAKLRKEFTETIHEAKLHIYVPNPEECRVEFEQRSFTLFFTTKDKAFLNEQNIPPKSLLKLFVRVKETVSPHLCRYCSSSTNIELTLIKSISSSLFWNRIDLDELLDELPVMHGPIALDFGTRIHTSTLDPLPTPQYKVYSSTSSVEVGFTGIYNPANSCFMNAALQCLSNTRELRDYFLKSRYLDEINRLNPLGMKGEMAEELASVIKDLWAAEHSYIYANRLRDLAAKRHQEFVGSGQHDAQELLNIVLDAIHEDLNRVVQKPLVPPVEDQNRPDEIVAEEFWEGYLKRNDSIVVQLFTGQFKSKTKCPQCQKESVAFDPFTTLSVPVPKRTNVDVIFIFRDVSKGSRKCRIVMQMDSSIKELKQQLAGKFNVPPEQMIAYRVRFSSEFELLRDDERTPTSNYAWNHQDFIFVTEILSSSDEPVRVFTFTQRTFKPTEFVSECAYCRAPAHPLRSSTMCTRCFRVSYCDETCQNFHRQKHQDNCLAFPSDYYETVGIPFIVSLPESQVNYGNIVEQINLNAKRYVEIRLKPPKRDDLYDAVEIDESDSFSDVESVDWAVIKQTLASTDSWSICRVGDYFVQKNQTKRTDSPRHKSSSDETEEFDMVEDVYPQRSLFRLMPQSTEKRRDLLPAIIEEGDESKRILRSYTTFFIDWFTDNNYEGPLRVLAPIERIGLTDLIDDDTVLSGPHIDQDATLTQCLQAFIEPEVLGPDDKWYCPNCKEHIQAEKKMSIWRLPPILIVHLKRFKYSQNSSFSYQSHSREKIETFVNFPINDLDMSPYCSSTAADATGPSNSRYDLFGVINHSGTAWFGHYTADARLLASNDPTTSEIDWRHFDDSRVTSVWSPKDLLRSDAYVLFYRHRQLTVDLLGTKTTLNEQTQSNTE